MAVKAVLSSAEPPREEQMPKKIKEVLEEWGGNWMWKSLRILGNDEWIKEAIEKGTLVVVTDGSYMRDMYPDICSAAFILECSKGSGRIIGSFSDQSITANAYRAELMGLLAIHLILKAANEIWPNLNGKVRIYSDCLGALGRVADLPPHKIPSRCSHSDILKIILVNCTTLSFTLQYEHVKAHQDDNKDFSKLTRAAQLNVHCDGMAKNVLWGFSGSDHPRQTCSRSSRWQYLWETTS